MIAGLVLAAGRSSRMGTPQSKVALPFGDRPMVRHVIDAALAAGLDEIVLVLGREAATLGPSFDALGLDRLRVVINEAWESGQASSLACGLRAMSDGTDAVVVLLGDQPTVRADAIRAVAEAFGAGARPIAQASYGGAPSHPTLLGREIWPAVESLAGDEGARVVIAAHPEWRNLIEVGGEPPQDVDTAEDYARLLSRIRANDG